MRTTGLSGNASAVVRAVMAGLLVAVCIAASRAASGGGGEAGDVERRAWRYVQNGVTVTITHLEGRAWVAERSDGKRPPYDEIGRAPDSITLQNRETKLLIRLHADRAFWRRPRDPDWTAWVRGSWIAAPPAPGGNTPVPMDGAAFPGRRIRVAYFVPRDRAPARDHAQKIRVVMALVADVYREDLRRKGYAGSEPRFETDGSGLVVHLVRGERTAAYYNNAPTYDANEQWRRLTPEIEAKVGDPRRSLAVVFAETYDSGPAEHLWPGVIARGAYHTAEGGLAVFSGHLLQDELCATTREGQLRLLFDETPVPGRKAWGRRINSARGELAEDGIGAVAHELGHALGLPHDRRDDARDLMGNGFRNLRRNLQQPGADRVGFSVENARLLMSSRYVAADLRLDDRQPPRVVCKPHSRDQAGWTVSVSVSDDTGLRAAVIVDRGAGSVIAGRKLTGTSQAFLQRIPLSTREAKLQVIVADDGGNQTRTEVTLRP